MSARAGEKPVRKRPPVFEAAAGWLSRRSAAAASPNGSGEYPPLDSILHSLPRREQAISPAHGRISLPLIEPTRFKTSLWKSLRRLFTWFRVIAAVLLGDFADRVLRRETVERRAVRLRRALGRG